MKRIISGCLVLLLCLSGCGGERKQEKPLEPAVDYNDPNTILGLTAQQKVEEFDFICETLDALYPYWSELEETGIDRKALYESYREKLEKTTTDIGYMNTLLQFFLTLQVNQAPIGHLGLLNADDYRYMVESEQTVEGPSIIKEVSQQAQAKALYAKLDRNSKQKFAKAAPGEISAPTGQGQPDASKAKPITCEILQEGSVGYLKIPSFGFDSMWGKMEEISDFIESCQSCQDIIIDVRGNSGGGSYPYIDHIIGPNITQPQTAVDYYLFNEAQITDSRLQASLLAQKPDIRQEAQPIAQLPPFENLSPYAANFSYFITNTRTIGPKPGQKPFQGRFWVLMDRGCYSSTEGFLSFCKQTKFATLVGQTSGGASPFQAAFFNTPHSGLIFRFDTFYGLNPDGSGNGLHGVAPDMECPPQDALAVCLSEIEKLQ